MYPVECVFLMSTLDLNKTVHKIHKKSAETDYYNIPTLADAIGIRSLYSISDLSTYLNLQVKDLPSQIIAGKCESDSRTEGSV